MAGAVAISLVRNKYLIRNQIVWSKPHFVIGRGDYHLRHEPCFYAVRKGAKADFIGPRNEQTIWDFPLDDRVEGGHSTQKPVEAFARPIRNHKGDVYEPFAGTGTAMFAADQLGRRCYMIEIEPKWCAVTLQRAADAGLTPRLVE